MQLLLKKWTYKDYTETSLVPPICVAAMQGNLELIKLFSTLKPHPNTIQTAHGATALQIAIAGHRQHIIRFLSQHTENKENCRDDNVESIKRHYAQG